MLYERDVKESIFFFARDCILSILFVWFVVFIITYIAAAAL